MNTTCRTTVCTGRGDHHRRHRRGHRGDRHPARLTSIAPDAYDLGERQLTAFISRPDGMAAAVAVLAGVVGMLALTEGRSGALVGVLVSVTTIPAIGNIGAAAAYASWDDVGGAALQLAIDVTGLVVAGVVTLAIQAHSTTRTGDAGRPGSAPGRARP